MTRVCLHRESRLRSGQADLPTLTSKRLTRSEEPRRFGKALGVDGNPRLGLE